LPDVRSREDKASIRTGHLTDGRRSNIQAAIKQKGAAADQIGSLAASLHYLDAEWLPDETEDTNRVLLK
jgi:hypothetical protein